MAVELIDPNYQAGNTNPDMINAIPQYQDMYIFAELTAYRRGRSTIGNNKLKTEDSVVVNFIGNNQNTQTVTNPNLLKFTTNWYDADNMNSTTQYEGFGMTSIKISVNSSYVPQVNIQFVDVRGMSFFYQTNSPYRILFDFPPPIFTLIVKGYYGMALQYKLHLVKYTSEFKGENGNYVIDAQFIAMTFAPLTDVLFRYAINFPLMTNESINANPSPNTPPKNTNELILKIKSLFHKLAENDEQSKDVKALENTIVKQDNNKVINDILNGYKTDTNLVDINPILWIYNTEYNENPNNQITEILQPIQYDKFITEIPTDGTPTKLNNDLNLVTLISKNMDRVEANKLAVNLSAYNKSPKDQKLDSKVKDYNDRLMLYRKYLIDEANNLVVGVVNESDIPVVQVRFINTTNAKGIDYNIVDVYLFLDITDYYIKIFKQKNELEKNKQATTLEVNKQINNIVFSELGMQPTIYNIFKIILDDVDIFFKKMNETSRLAEDHHKRYANQIVGNAGYKDVTEHIYAFPLVVKEQFVCKEKTETRISPLDISNSLPEQFPEMMLVDEFMKSFYKQKVVEDIVDMRNKQNEDGSFVWIPITPQDSKIGGSNAQSPYLGTDATVSNESFAIPINTSQDKRLVSVFKTLLNRFYVLSQSTYRGDFYGTNPLLDFVNYLVSGSYIEKLVQFTSDAEAYDLSSSMANPDYINLMYNIADNLSKEENIESFYEYVKLNIPELYSFTPENKPSITDGNITYFLNKGMGGNPTPFDGAYIYEGSISVRPFDKDNANRENPVDNYQKNVNDTWINFRVPYEFTMENVLYLNDVNPDSTEIVESRFIAYRTSINTDGDDLLLSKDLIILNEFWDYFSKNKEKIDKKKLVEKLSEFGNKYFNMLSLKEGTFPPFQATTLKAYGDIFDIWKDQLSYVYKPTLGSNKRADVHIYDTLKNPNISNKVKSIIILSNVGFTLSPFNVYPHQLNIHMFNTAGAYQAPSFLSPYIGSLIDITEDSKDYKDLYDFFVNEVMISSGIYVFADIHDINKYLSFNDKYVFKTAYTEYIDGDNYQNNLKSLTDILSEGTKLDYGTIRDGEMEKYYSDQFNPDNSETKGYQFIKILMNRITLINYNKITFNVSNKNIVGFHSLEELNKIEDYKKINNKYFVGFFNNLRSSLKDRKDKLNESRKEYLRLIGDTDIMTQCYYSFKNINDKWLTSPSDNTASGDMIVVNGKLIDSFAFVDRAMRPIGNTIINPEALIDMFNDENLSVYSVLSQLLSSNGFEFFPLQNFMSYNEGDWIKSFKINTTNRIQSNPVFVCMFVGGSSSYPTGIYKGSQFLDDGIADIRSEEFVSSSCSGSEINQSEDGQIAGSTLNNRNDGNLKFKGNYGQVKAFWVNFAQQNQSMFSSIKFDSKEFPETNESIQIMSRIAGDNKLQAPPPKGQNLYNMYENRAYKATVSGLGNVMIQPTQYFQVGNVPMFNGIYLILSVEHNIEPNKMTTSFSGTKILKYQIPRVLTPSALFGYDAGNTENTNPALMFGTGVNGIAYGVNAGEFPQTQFNSMYNLKTR